MFLFHILFETLHRTVSPRFPPRLQVVNQSKRSVFGCLGLFHPLPVGIVLFGFLAALLPCSRGALFGHAKALTHHSLLSVPIKCPASWPLDVNATGSSVVSNTVSCTYFSQRICSQDVAFKFCFDTHEYKIVWRRFQHLDLESLLGSVVGTNRSCVDAFDNSSSCLSFQCRVSPHVVSKAEMSREAELLLQFSKLQPPS